MNNPKLKCETNLERISKKRQQDNTWIGFKFHFQFRKVFHQNSSILFACSNWIGTERKEMKRICQAGRKSDEKLLKWEAKIFNFSVPPECKKQFETNWKWNDELFFYAIEGNYSTGKWHTGSMTKRIKDSFVSKMQTFSFLSFHLVKALLLMGWNKGSVGNNNLSLTSFILCRGCAGWKVRFRQLYGMKVEFL